MTDCSAATLLKAAVANGELSLDDELTLLAMAGAVAIVDGMNSKTAMAGAAASGYYNLDERQL